MRPSNRATHKGIIGLVVDETAPRATHKGIIGLVVDETKPLRATHKGIIGLVVDQTKPLRALDGSRGAPDPERPLFLRSAKRTRTGELVGRAS